MHALLIRKGEKGSTHGVQGKNKYLAYIEKRKRKWKEIKISVPLATKGRKKKRRTVKNAHNRKRKYHSLGKRKRRGSGRASVLPQGRQKHREQTDPRPSQDLGGGEKKRIVRDGSSSSCRLFKGKEERLKRSCDSRHVVRKLGEKKRVRTRTYPRPEARQKKEGAKKRLHAAYEVELREKKKGQRV